MRQQFSSAAEKQRAYRQRKKDNGWQDKRGNRHTKSITWPFIGIDGEGGDINGRHHYLMLRSGDDTKMHWDRSPLGTWEILDFLCNLPRKERINVGYFFNYDVTHIVKDLPPYKLHRLMHRELRKRVFNNRTHYYPVDWCGFEIDYLSGKEFKVRRQGEKTYFVINDVGSFFQCAFLTALKQWKIGTEEDWKHIAEGKSGRVNFAELTDDTIAYNGREIVLLEQLMTEFRKATIEAGMLPAKWQGPGQIATSIFKQTGMIKGEQLRESLPPELLSAANASYFGGRFEITAIGQIPGPVYQHDINSAYPYAETLLPCLEHGQWTHTLGTQLPDSGLFLAYGTFRAREEVNLYGLPHRTKKGNICWPGKAGEGWYWSHEIREAVYQEFWASERWDYINCCSCTPFNWVPAKYEERAKLGKEAKGIAIKLGLNSTYGKTCQSVGEPQYANPIYASLITSITRAQLYRKCVRFGLDKVVMLATDGIFTTSEVDKDHSPKIDKGSYTVKPLGDWEVTTYPEGIFIIQPGLYLLPGDAKPKTRGVPQNKVLDHVDEFRTQYEHLSKYLKKSGLAVSIPTPESIERFKELNRSLARNHKRELPPLPSPFLAWHVPIEVRSLMNVKLATHLKRWDELGQWIPNVRRISFDWTTKRDGRNYTVYDSHISTAPISSVHDNNTPYSKDIGAMFTESMLNSGYYADPDSPEFIGAPDGVDQW